MNLKAAVESVHFPLWRYNPGAEGKKLTLDSADKSDTVSFAANAVSKELGENRFKQLVKETRHPAASQSGSDAAGSRVSIILS